MPAPEPTPGVAGRPPDQPSRRAVRSTALAPQEEALDSPDQPPRERHAFMRWLFKQHGPFILAMLLSRTDVLPESAKDLRQEVLIRVDKYVAQHEIPENLRGFLWTAVRNAITNHKQEWRPDVAPGVDAGLELSRTADPEELATYRDWLSRYLAALPEAEAEVVWHVDALGYTIDQTAQLLRRPRGTVATQRDRGKDRLEEMALESLRAVTLGERRPAGR